MEAKCENYNGVLVGTKEKKVIVVHARCKQWNCEYCAYRNAQQWRGHLLNRINQIESDESNRLAWFMLTITAARWNRTAAGSAASLQDVWNTVAQLIRDKTKHLGQKASYVRVFEAHADGAIHLHAIIRSVSLGNAWINTNEVRKTQRAIDRGDANVKLDNAAHFTRLKDYIASKRGLGYMCELVKIVPYSNYNPTAVAVKYVTKYMTKSAQNFELPKHARRIVTSRDLAFRHPEDKSDYQWRYCDEFTESDFVRLTEMGYEVYDTKKRANLEYADFFED